MCELEKRINEYVENINGCIHHIDHVLTKKLIEDYPEYAKQIKVLMVSDSETQIPHNMILTWLEEMRKDFLGVLIHNPKEHEYELTIPYQLAVYESDKRVWNVFVKWFGESK